MKNLHIAIALIIGSSLQAQDTLSSAVLNAFKFRDIGPAVTGGRIIDIAVDPTDVNTYFVAAAYGGVWRTDNAGTTFSPVFDNYGTQSIGCVSIDPSNHLNVWVGTGENNNQRSVGYGNGIYLSQNGGKTFTNMGLKESQHIGMIKIHPSNSKIVYVATYGPVWNKGGERGLYKTLDGGKTWKAIKTVSEYTGCNEVHLDPNNPEIIYAAFHQRERRQWTYMGGGPESNLFKSKDGGETWKSITSGFPGGDKGRITLCIAPGSGEQLYAMVETEGPAGGLFISTDRGESWKKTNSTYTAGNYYQEIMADPIDKNRLFIMDTYLQWSKDGGQTISKVGEKNKHVDNHAIWINPSNTAHWRVGCDGGLYETFDNGETFIFKDNLPIAQFYRVALDNDKPFYNVYGGTQDNNTLGGPSQNSSGNGISNSDWFVTVGGDGFKSQVDPTNPNVVYSQWQYGGLIRYDRVTGNITDVKPKVKDPLRWNWDAPLLISNHNPTVLYYCANKVFKSTDKGSNWELISGDLTQQINRNKLKVMDQYWGPDAVAKDQSVSMYGTIIYFDESRLDANLLAAGMDDGLIQVSEDGGKNWQKCKNPADLPAVAAISSVHFSKYDKSTIYATWDNHKDGDFKPYLYESNNLGKTWRAVHSNLPKNGSVKCFAQDFKDKNLLFCGTEFGAWVSPNGGLWWGQLKNGLPPIAIMDIEIQERESDLVLATFGRGFVILDNYAPLRSLNKELFSKNIAILPIKTGKLFVEKNPLGGKDNGNKGASYYQTKNPEMGPQIYYWIKESRTSPKTEREKKEGKTLKTDKFEYPSLETLRAEEEYEAPLAIFIIKDNEGNEIRRLTGSASKGLHSINWDMRHSDVRLLNKASKNMPGFLVNPGNYSIEMSVLDNGIVKSTEEATPFSLEEIYTPSIETLSNASTLALIKEVNQTGLSIDVLVSNYATLQKRVNALENAIFIPKVPLLYAAKVTEVKNNLDELKILIYGDNLKDKYETERSDGLNELLGGPAWSLWATTTGATGTHAKQVALAKEELKTVLTKYTVLESKVAKIESELIELGVIIKN